MKRSDKKNFVQKLKDEINSSSSVIVAHYAGLSVLETDNLRKEMRDNGAKFKVTKNRLTKLALADTPNESIADLFSGPTAIAYSSDPVAPAKVSVSFEKKLENFKIVGGSYEGEKIDKSKKTRDFDRRVRWEGLGIFSRDYLPPWKTLNFLFLVNCEFPFL